MAVRAPLRRQSHGAPTYRRKLRRTILEPEPSRTKRNRAAARGARAVPRRRPGYLSILRAARNVPYPIRTKEIGAYVGDRRVRLGKHAGVSMFEVLGRIPNRNFENHDEFKGAVLKHWDRIEALATPRHRDLRAPGGRTLRRARGTRVARASNKKPRPSGPA
jgi:hypothetical protein